MGQCAPQATTARSFAELKLAQGDESSWQTTPAEQCEKLATGIPDYQLRRKVAMGHLGFEPRTNRLKAGYSTAELISHRS
jgi:hypothetical protein